MNDLAAERDGDVDGLARPLQRLLDSPAPRSRRAALTAVPYERVSKTSACVAAAVAGLTLWAYRSFPDQELEAALGAGVLAALIVLSILAHACIVHRRLWVALRFGSSERGVFRSMGSGRNPVTWLEGEWDVSETKGETRLRDRQVVGLLVAPGGEAAVLAPPRTVCAGLAFRRSPRRSH